VKTRVPFFDLARAHDRISGEVKERFARVFANTAFVLGPEGRELERRFGDYVGSAGCVAVANGTDALTLSLRALGIGAGDEVLVPAFTFFASASAVVLAGGRPVFVDIDPDTFLVDLDDAARRSTSRTVGLIVVHLYGCPVELMAARRLCARHGWWLLEDAAQAHGARFDGKAAGSWGELATWSFYPSKNLGCFGDGGAVTGRRVDLIDRVRLLANHGQSERYLHLEIATNSRLDELQAAVLNCRLGGLEADNTRRRALAARYDARLAGVGDLALQRVPPGALPVYHQLAVRTAYRDALRSWLLERGVGCAIHYPRTLAEQPAFADLNSAQDYPHSRAAARELLCLPMFPELRDDEVEIVCDEVSGFFRTST
jgi:dTDP-4-amino-4,6-dideoxygalactose transaminase